MLAARARANAWTGTARMLWPEIARVAWDLGRDALGEPTARSLRLLDVACGGGDVALDLWKRARRRGVRLSIEGCDSSATAVAYAGEQASALGADVRFSQCDAFSLPTERPFNIVTCALFLHRLEREQAVELLARLSSVARHLLLVADYERCRAGHVLARVGTGIFTSSAAVREEAQRAVESAFRADEVLALAKEAGLKAARVERRWPFRWLLMESKDTRL
jgi:2-polyprenyl-3-methyl-5-hydroxy-6-metoxy-1,4-benzoquinol methylase